MNHKQLSSILKYIWDPEEFLANYGLRSMSRYHEKNPFVFRGKSVGYEPSESLSTVKGWNSNWRGPIWLPTTFLLVESLLKLAEAYSEDIPTVSKDGSPMNMLSMAQSFANRVIALFKADSRGYRPFLGEDFPFQRDPHFENYLLFYEYYNPETGKGLGASHQTGWSALVANFIQDFRM